VVAEVFHIGFAGSLRAERVQDKASPGKDQDMEQRVLAQKVK